MSMKQAQQDFLNLARLPGTIDAQQAGYLLGIAPAHVSILVSKGFLRPLGRSLAANAPRRFSSTAICKLASDPHEMDKMHQTSKFVLASSQRNYFRCEQAIEEGESEWCCSGCEQ